jgi:2-furoyl-CoA dehydrogenase large subunit
VPPADLTLAISLTVNGAPVARSVSPRQSLADFLRVDLGLTGTHVGCEHGVCGACTVLVDGRSARSCLLLAVQADGAAVTTIEGLTPPDGLSPLQQAFRACHGLQCGFCTPGLIVATHELLTANPRPTEAEIRDALSGNLCMCTGYVNVVRAVEDAANRLAAPRPPAPDPVPVDGRWVGTPLVRKEDDRLLAGRGLFVDDVPPAGHLHAAILRSPYPHAQILEIDTRAAAAMPGVLAVVTGAQAAELTRPIRPLIPTRVPVPDYCLAVDRVRFVGEPVAAVAAIDRATAEDALERIAVTYAPLEAVVDPERALEPDSPVLYPALGSNVVWHDTLRYGEVDAAFAAADGTLRERFTMQRYASTPLETFACIAEYDSGTDAFSFWTNDQRIGLTMAVLAESLGVPESRLRLRTPDIGGGFGNKRRPAYLLIAALLARLAGQPVRWIEDRAENLTALMHACNGVIDVELAYRTDGRVLGLRVRDIADEGKNLVTAAQHNLIKLGNIANGYRIPAIAYEGFSVLTNKCPTGANRGIGKPLMCFAIERAMALLARRLAVDPVELRQRNYVTPAEMPYATPTGARYDSGDYGATMATLVARLPYGEWRARQAAARQAGRLLGIGIASSVEPGGTNLASYELITGRRVSSGSAEGALVRIEPDGSITAALGDPPSGQGYETAIAQVVADELGVRPADVQVQRGVDTATTPWMYLSGNYSNKFSVTDVGAIVGAARKVRAQVLQIAAFRLEVDIADLELRDGHARVHGSPAAGLSLRELARTAYQDPLGLPPGLDPGLEARHFYQNPLAAPVDADRRVRGQLVFANAAHGCVVEVDPRSGAVHIQRYVVVHDCGAELNPRLVEGMVHGSTAHGIGAALLEELCYDADGQFLTSTFMDYLKPTATDVPPIEVYRVEHPSPFTALGLKGVGEGGSLASPAAVANAVEDALRGVVPDVVVRTLPLSPQRVWQLLTHSAPAAPGRDQPREDVH